MDAPVSWLSIAPPLGAAGAVLAPHDDDDDDAFLAAQFRRSVDCDDDSDALDAVKTDRRPLPAALPLPALDAADAALWNLISPCSDASEPPDFDDLPPETQEEHEDQQDHLEPEASPRATAASSMDQCVIKPVFVEEEDVRYASSSDSEDEEVEVFNAATEFPPLDADTGSVRRRARSLDSDKSRDDALDSVTEGDECFDELDVLSSSASSSLLFVDDSASEDGAAAVSGGNHSSTASSSSSSAAARASLAWVGRVKARTYSGPSTLQLHGAIDKLRARTRSATATLRHAAAASTGSMTTTEASGHEDDDGGFSSDDEDFDHARASRVPTPTTRATSLSFPTRLSAVKNLQGLQLPTKMASMMRFRSSSSATTSSEDSFIGSHGSFPDAALGSGSSAGDAPATSKPTATASSAYNRQELKHKASACATRAAGLLGAASAEAARKLRTTRAFRTSSASSMAATSPVVDREESSPGLPPLPARAASSSTSS